MDGDVFVQERVDLPTQNLPGQTIGGNGPGQHASRRRRLLKHGYLIPLERKEVGGGQSRGSCPDHRHREGLCPGFYFRPRSIGKRGNLISDKSLESPYRQGFASAASQAAFLLAGVMADPGADRRKGVGFPDGTVGLLVFSLLDMGNVAPGFRSQRAGGLARRSHQVLAHARGTAPVLDVFQVFIAKIAERGEHRVGRRLSEAAESGVLDHPGQFFQKVQMG